MEIQVNGADRLIQDIKAKIADRQILANDLVELTTYAMQLAQMYHLPGPQKKQLVVQAIQYFVEESGLLEETSLAAAKLFIQTTLPILIDTMVDAARGNIDLGKRIASSSKWCCGE